MKPNKWTQNIHNCDTFTRILIIMTRRNKIPVRGFSDIFSNCVPLEKCISRLWLKKRGYLSTWGSLLRQLRSVNVAFRLIDLHFPSWSFSPLAKQSFGWRSGRGHKGTSHESKCLPAVRGFGPPGEEICSLYVCIKCICMSIQINRLYRWYTWSQVKTTWMCFIDLETFWKHR